MAPSAVEQPPPLSFRPERINDDSTTKSHDNEWYRQNQTDYRILEQPLYTKRPLRMIIIGAGAAGLQIAYKAERQLSSVTFQIYEKNHDVGGTWLENRYPGCTCDIPSHSYQWSFWRNPNWSSYYASAPEIWQYLKDFAVHFGLEKYVKLNHKVLEAKWNQGEGVWEVKVQGPHGNVFVDRGDILACCNGVLK
jgi:cation diffusion facilitator CzcD-associated flavoprotein CzcO